MRRLFALSLLILSLACSCAAGLAAPAALAAGSSDTTTPSFGLSSGGAATTPAVTTTATPVVTTSSSSGGLSTLDGVVIGAVVLLLLGGVAFWIWWDARGNVARISHGKKRDEGLFNQRAHAGSKTPQKSRKHKPAERKRRKRGRAR